MNKQIVLSGSQQSLTLLPQSPMLLAALIKVSSVIIHSFHSFIFHSVNPYKVPNNLKDIELVILLIIYT